MNRLLKIALPLLVILVAGLAVVAMVRNRPEVKRSLPEVKPPTVRVIEVQPRTVSMTVSSQGTAAPRTSTQLVPEVSGRVISVSPAFVDGGFFAAGEVLFSIDANDYRWALIQARSRALQAELRLEQERANAEVARDEWEQIGEGEGTPLALRTLQVREAEAALAAARASLEQAERDLERTNVRAPFSGRVLTKSIDVGQFVSRGAPAATVYAIDVAEVRLPVSDEDLAFLELPLGLEDRRAASQRPAVTLIAQFAGQEHRWSGRIVRTEGQIDPKSRLVFAIAEVRQPYSRPEGSDRPPLAAGMFVNAEIHGRAYDDIVVLPRVALRDDRRVMVVDGDDRLRFREVVLLRIDGDEIYVSGGLEPGERVCVSALEATVDGMRVLTIEDDDHDRSAREERAAA